MNKIILMLAVISSLFVSIKAAPGDLDTSFDTDSKVTTVVEANSYSRSADIAIQPDGKMVVVGISQVLFRYICLVRYNPNGSLDNSLFGNGGIVSTDFSNSGDVPSRLLIQPDGKIVAAGYTSAQNSFTEEFAVARYLGDLAPPAAANVSISGQVLSSNKQGISRVSVALTDSNGNARTAATNSFGNYNFDEVPAGQTYVVSVNHKKYVFSPDSQVLNVSEDLSGIDFTAGE